MTDAINANNRIKAPNQPTEQRSTGASNSAPSSAPSSPASAIVDLSSDKVMEQLANVPEIDSSRVENIKNALANGEYHPDPEVIAQKFAEIERLLPG